MALAMALGRAPRGRVDRNARDSRVVVGGLSRAPRGRVDRNRTGWAAILKGLVAPPAGAWIET